MLRPRITPCLLLQDGALVKTIGFAAGKYIGDPLNAVRIFNEKEVDELVVLDICATRLGREPDYGLIRKLASECRMPLCYGGGVRTTKHVEALVALGVEKVAIGAAALEEPTLIAQAARQVGSQSIVGVVDVRGGRGSWQAFVRNGTQATGMDAPTVARRLQDAGAGEILINAIDRDGQMTGYDLALVDVVRRATTVPLTVVGGAGSLEDIAALVRRFGSIGAAAGSLFVYKGRFKAVLINYPDRSRKDHLVRDALGLGVAAPSTEAQS
ncbi:MAG: AglZ/HisF2 family acetamidino modification protein [Thermoplasmatota archaeon]